MTGRRRQARRRDPESRDPEGGAPGSASESSRTATARGEGDGRAAPGLLGTERHTGLRQPGGAPGDSPAAGGSGREPAAPNGRLRSAQPGPCPQQDVLRRERRQRCFGGRAARLGRAEARENGGVKNGAKGRQQPRQGATGRSSGWEAARAAERSQREAAGTVRSGWCAHWMPRGGRSSRGAERRPQTGAPPLGTGEPTGPRGQVEPRPGDRIRGPEGH